MHMVVGDKTKLLLKNVAFWLVIYGLAAMLAYLVSTDERSWRWKVFEVAFPIWATLVLVSLHAAWQRRREMSLIGK
jgi:hypothetical protein